MLIIKEFNLKGRGECRGGGIGGGDFTSDLLDKIIRPFIHFDTIEIYIDNLPPLPLPLFIEI